MDRYPEERWDTSDSQCQWFPFGDIILNTHCWISSPRNSRNSRFFLNEPPVCLLTRLYQWICWNWESVGSFWNIHFTFLEIGWLDHVQHSCMWKTFSLVSWAWHPDLWAFHLFSGFCYCKSCFYLFPRYLFVTYYMSSIQNRRGSKVDPCPCQVFILVHTCS